MRPTPRIALAALTAALAALTLLPATPAAAVEADPPVAEQQFVAMLNQTRASHGLKPLSVDPVAADLGRNWSKVMAGDTHLRHNPDVAAQVERWAAPKWQRVGENVGYGWSVQSLHDAFYASPGHKANMVGDYNRVGVGVVVTDRIWVTFVFIKAPGTPPMKACTTSGYVLDGYGGVHALGRAPALRSRGYWPGWNVARDLALAADGKGGQKLDAFGGLWPVGDAPRLQPSGYWPGWDVARAVAVTPDGKGAYVLDAFGGLHAAGNAPPRQSKAYWAGWPVARDVVLDPADGARGYVLDAFGGLHPFGGMAAARLSSYFSDAKAVSVTLAAGGQGGYVTDRRGGVHPFAVGSAPMPPAVSAPPSFSGQAVGSLMGDVPAVATSNGGLMGAGGSGCGASGSWPQGLARASVSLSK